MAKRPRAKPAGLAELLRQRIRESELSHRKLGEACGVPQQRISTFASGGDIRLATAQKLMDHFQIVCK